MYNFNISPYYDDFDKDKKFYRILFVPSYAVQTRELTQIQSIIQEQIKKFGDHIFEEGAMVIPGQITFDNDISYQKMNATYGNPPYETEVNPENFLGKTVIGESSGVEGEIINAAPKDENDPLTFMVKFKNSGNDNVSIGFWDGETIHAKDNPELKATVQGVLNTSNPTFDSTGKGSISSIEAGVYYFNGMFLDVEKQSIIVSKYTSAPSVKIGLNLIEDIVTPEEDASLNDNARNTPNYSAPGAHRYKVTLKLEYVEEDEEVSDNFIILQIIRGGFVVKEIRTTDYSELEKTFARRTYDESGSYTVHPFSITMKEHYRDEDDDRYKEGAYFPPVGDKTKLAAEIGTGKAYVLGYENELIHPTLVNIDKARDFAVANNTIANFHAGNYIEVTNIHNIPRIDEFGLVHLYNSVAVPGGNNGDEVGTCRVKTFLRIDDTRAYMAIFDINMKPGKYFESDVKWFFDPNGFNFNNFTCEPILDGGRIVLNDVSHNMLLVPTAHNTIKTFLVGGTGIDTNYNSTRAYFNTGVVNGTATLTAKDNELFQQNTNSYVIAYTSNGNIVNDATFNFTGNPTGKVLEIGNLTGAVNIIAPVTKTLSTQKTKYLHEDKEVTITNPNKKPGSRDYLGKADGIRLKKVYMSNSLNDPPSTSDRDVTSRYQFDTGQRDNYYDVCSIILKPGQMPPTGQLLVIFDYFTHTEGDYFSVDSYVDIEFDQIPVYDSKESGGSYVLADTFDFRPRMADDRSGFTGVGASIGELPQMFSDVHADYEYYLNRIDYLYLTYRGEFKVVKGTPEIVPKPPEKPADGMVLYELFIHAYTFTPDDVEPTFKDHRRYTMKDIGDLDRRIGNLEYYTLLSLLERETASMEILDENGLNRYKNGFIVDPFDSHKAGDSTHNDYQCSVDPHAQLMRPKFDDSNISLLGDVGSSNNIQVSGTLMSLPYTHVGINAQLKASKYENINPFAFRNIFGKLNFNPNSDVWHDKKRLPTLIVNHSPNYEALKFIGESRGDVNGIEWGSWNNVGGRKLIRSTSKSSTKTKRLNRRNTGISHSKGWLKDISTTTTITTNTYSQSQARQGVKITHKDSNVMSSSLGDRVSDVNYIPYMRSIPVLIWTTEMKPNTKLYPFFDGIAMSKQCDPPSKYDYCTPCTIINITGISQSGALPFRYDDNIYHINGGSVKGRVIFATDDYIVVYNVYPNSINVGERYKFGNAGIDFVVTGVQYGNLGDPIISGPNGEVALIWQIPNDDTLRFMTGEREFRLTDQITNADPVHTMAKGMFKSHGMSSTVQDTVLSTKTLNFSKQNVRQSRVIQNQESHKSVKTRESKWFDPLAQSFLINESGGCFLTKVDIWFQSKDEKESVVCEVRNMVNGYPTELPMASATLLPSEVKTSERQPGEPTTFVFDEPVYLKETASYCIVLKPAVSSANYQVWVAETGRPDIKTGELITGKESLGSLFMSQNASTWTPNQNEDLMFKLYKAKFDISSSGTAVLVNSDIEPEELGENMVETFKDTPVIRVHHPNHGMTVNSEYTLSGFNDSQLYNGILGSLLNGEHTVTSVEMDSFTFETSDGSLATDSGLVGEKIYGIRNYPSDLFRPLVNTMLLEDTNIDWTIHTTTTTSLGGSQIPYMPSEPKSCINNEDFYPDAAMVVASKANEDKFLSGAKSFKMVGVLTSTNENVSPIIDTAIFKPSEPKQDISTSTLITISNRIDKPHTINMAIENRPAFSVGNGEDELVISHPDHGLGSGAMIEITNFTANLNLQNNTFDPNGWHEITIVDKDTYLIQMKDISSGYQGDGGGNVYIRYSDTNYIYVPEIESFKCTGAARYLTKQVNLQDPAENIKITFGAVREVNADIDVYYKYRTPYETTEWNEIKWIRIDSPDEIVPISQNREDFKDYTYTVEDIEPFNSISVKLVMTSTDSTQVPIFTDFRLICTT